ncbi:hypothetical protein KIN20_018577 [Parelaphostrongylus tenuis]|uniref:Uncharacterized protein n=1 Tax=Parelaphostrongylus tenuis TaxID=148309 RepID=A0AAD5N3W1_PARTN|nr:hypothetical protein KIN20_018577 [Parelaphostrongylus tenuis]
MKFSMVFFLLNQGFGVYSKAPFNCFGEHESDCPTEICFYSIDSEKSCYRTGCATIELCKGRRHNECFISNGTENKTSILTASPTLEAEHATFKSIQSSSTEWSAIQASTTSTTPTNRILPKQSSSVSATQGTNPSPPQVFLSTFLPRTTQYSLSITTSIPASTTIATTTAARITSSRKVDHTQSASALPDLFYARKQAEQQEPTIAENTKTSQLTTTTASFSSAVRFPIAPAKHFSFAEQRQQIESESLITPFPRRGQTQKLIRDNSDHKTSSESTQTNSERTASSSLISVHKVTTLAAKNKENEIHQSREDLRIDELKAHFQAAPKLHHIDRGTTLKRSRGNIALSTQLSPTTTDGFINNS